MGFWRRIDDMVEAANDHQIVVFIAGMMEPVGGNSAIVHALATELYLGSRAYDMKSRKSPEPAESRSQRQRFYREAGDILATLGTHGHPAITHKLLETYEKFVDIDPRDVFLSVYRLVQAGANNGYQRESLATDLVVAFVGRYLADHRALLKEDKACRDGVRDMLDIFVRAGWTKARRLTHRLEELFR